MRFITFVKDNIESIGVLTEDSNLILDLSNTKELNHYGNMLNFIKNCKDETIGLINHYLCKANDSKLFVKKEDVKLISPIPTPLRNIICLGLNYYDHALESQKFKGNSFTLPEAPVYFSKMASNIIASEEAIKSHQELTNQLDYEVELAVIIGKEGSNILKERAEEYIFGYSILNDITARDLQKKHTQWLKGKSLDTFSIMGPCITHKSSIPFPVHLNIQSSVNGEIRQNSNTSKLIFDIPTIISDLSQGVTLRAGDIIATGTPAGVGMGFQPPRFLMAGDEVICSIEKIGSITNTVI
ncbi:fumarylacetoacetate hydrolase family protein [Alkaliphilus pronyensis]|uniref:Fumarylacetoacetate hydrolase family protein n=1 Tax=Alkaliphilus pronyensis TaxID=1482732 RepID=A0A6I0F852_9FIRM|nr:fumarylacetoacetate hydrolase family protein [Alkaliphilus pronyensis]KAB3534506.1 fumarylacetoacetate hydrolase family protein [Alkaliphilus pronyensis]